jgi:hypothetical protein
LDSLQANSDAPAAGKSGGFSNIAMQDNREFGGFPVQAVVSSVG